MNSFEVNHYWVEQLIAISQLIIDFGLVILIWMVQLIVYPSFLHFSHKNLVTWHQKYTQRITVIVVPLMFLQLALAIYTVFHQFSTTTVITLITVIFLWVFTFLGFAPVHFKISEGKFNKKILETLVIRNWWRTFLWSALFVFDCFYLMKFFTHQL